MNSIIRTLLRLTGLTQAAASLRAFAARVRAMAAQVAAASRRAGDALRRAFGPATRAAILLTAAAIRRVSKNLDSVTKAATRAGVRMSVTGAKFLAILTAIAVAGTAAGVAVAGIAGLGAGALVAGGSAALAVKTATTQEAAAQEVGASRAKTAGLSNAATAFGFDPGEAEGALSSLREKIADAAAGGESAALFDKLGVEVFGDDLTDTQGKLLDTIDVLGELDQATKRLSQKDRAKAFADVFGADAERMRAFVDGGGVASAKAASERAKRFGAIATDGDVAMVRDFKSAINDLVLSFRALALAVSRRILPGLTKTTRVLSEWIAANREVFAAKFAAGWDRVMKAMSGALSVLRVIPLASGFVVRSMHTLLGVLTDVGRYLAGDYISIDRSWVYELMRAIHATIATFSALVGSGGGGLVGALSRGWVEFLYILAQTYAAFLGLDGVVRYGWVLTMRDGVVAIVGIISKLPAYIAALPPQFDAAKAVVVAVIGVIKQAVLDSVAALLAFSQLSAEQAMALIETKIAAFQARVAEAIRPVREAMADIWEVLRDGESAQVESPFVAEFKQQLVSLREVAIAFWSSLQKAWALFREVLDVIHEIIRPVLDFFGYDILTATLFLGMLKLSGLLGLLTSAVGLLASGFAGLFSLSGLSLSGFLAGILGSMGSLATMIPQIAVLAAAAWAGVKAGQYVGEKFYEGSDMKAADDAEFEARLATLRNSNNYLHDRHLAALAARPKAPEIPIRTGDVLMSDGKTLDMDELWKRKGGGGSTDTVNVNFNVGRTTAAFSGTRSAVDDLNRALADARNAGGLR